MTYEEWKREANRLKQLAYDTETDYLLTSNIESMRKGRLAISACFEACRVHNMKWYELSKEEQLKSDTYWK